MERINIDLPKVETLHELAQAALADLRKCQIDSDRFTINMWHWHKPVRENWGQVDETTKCAVCLAGAWMAQTCDVPDFVKLELHLLDDDSHRIMCALDSLRVGYVLRALETFYVERESCPRAVTFDSWVDDQKVHYVEYTRPDTGESVRTDVLASCYVTQYKDNADEFFEDMRVIVAMLKKHGL